MGKKIEFICDRCGHTQNDDAARGIEGNRDFYTIGLLVRPGYQEFYNYSHQVSVQTEHLRASKLWCASCAVDSGLLTVVKKPDRQPYLAPSERSLEDVIKDWIADAVQDAR